MADGGEKKKAYRFPKSLSACVARLALLRAQVEAASAELKPAEDEEAALHDHLLETFRKAELDGLTAHGLRLSIKTSSVPTLDDWDLFFAFAKSKKNFDLLQRSVNTPAWRERLKAGVRVPGVKSFDRVGLSVTRVKGKKA
jgi:hypothetical protein